MADGQATAKIARNSRWNILSWLCLMVLGFVSAPIMVRQLGTNLYGLMALVTSLIAPLGLVDFGMGEATVKYVAESLGRGDRGAAERYLRATCSFNIMAGLFGMLLLAGLSSFLVLHTFNIAAENTVLARRCLLLAGVLWGITQVRQTFVGAVTALQNYKVVGSGLFLTQLAHVGTGLGVLLAGGSLLLMLGAQVIAAFASLTGWILITRRLLPDLRLSPKIDRAAMSRSSRFGVWQMLNNLFGLFVHQGQRWVLGAVLSVAAVGFYNLANQLVTVIYSAAYRVGQVMFPAISHLSGEGRQGEAEALMVQFSWILVTFVLPAYLVLAICASDILRLWISPDVAIAAAPALRVMVFGFSFGCMFAVPNFFLLGVGMSHWLTVVAVVQGTIAFTLSILLVPHWGVAGAASAVAVATCVVYSASLVMIWRKWLRDSVSFGIFFSATFSPVLTVAGMAAVLVPARDLARTWQPGWGMMLAAAIPCYGGGWLAIQAVNRALPGGRDRWLQLWQVVRHIAGRRLTNVLNRGNRISAEANSG